MASYTTGYGLFNFLSFIPRSVRYVEVPIVVFGYVWSILYARKQDDQLKEPVGLAPLGLLWLIGCLGFLGSSASLPDSIESLYTFSMPILVFGTLWNLSPTDRNVHLWRAFMYLAVGANIVLGAYQIVTFDPRLNADAVNGLMRDAHHLGNYLFIFLLIEVGILLGARRFLRVVLLLPVLLVACATFNEKSILFFAVLLVALLLFSRGVSLGRKAVSVAAVAAVVLGLFQIAKAEDVSGLRSGAMLQENLRTLGTVQGYAQLESVFQEHPDALLLGVGAGNYGSSIALRRAVNGEDLSPIAVRYNPWMLELSTLSGGYDFTSNYFTGLLVEHGAIAFACIVYSLFVIFRAPFDKRDFASIAASPLPFAVSCAVVFLTLNGLVTNVSGWDEMSLAAPVLFFAAWLGRQGRVNGL
jgi:hypothetical protein